MTSAASLAEPSEGPRDAAHAHAIGTASYFESIHEDGRDPFGLSRRPYELRKRQVALACLPRRRYRRALEAGCSVGTLTAELAARAGAVVALDVARNAVTTARQRLAHLSGVEVRAADVRDFPIWGFDLVVLSELGYYLGRSDLARLAARIGASLDRGGHVLAVHWRPAIDNCEMSGDEVHGVLLAERRLERLGGYCEQQFRVDVLRRRGDAAGALPEAEAEAGQEEDAPSASDRPRCGPRAH